MIGKELIDKISELGIRKVKSESPLTCSLEKGVCKNVMVWTYLTIEKYF